MFFLLNRAESRTSLVVMLLQRNCPPSFDPVIQCGKSGITNVYECLSLEHVPELAVFTVIFSFFLVGVRSEVMELCLENLNAAWQRVSARSK